MRFNFKNIVLSSLVGLLLFTTEYAFGQSAFQSETEMKTKAAEYFAADQFTRAFPLYSQLLSLDPKNIELNYRFGVCLLYSDRSKTKEPFKYLEKAINKISDINLYYYLAEAYHKNYYFKDAIYNYRKYLQLAQNNPRKDFDVNRKIVMCQNGMEILKAANDLYVMQNSEVDRKAFYRSYNLVNFGGRIINLPVEFLSKSDKKNQADKITFFNPKAKLLFYAIENKNQKDIYYRIRREKGDWSNPILLGPTINTSYDEDNPVLMADGKTLYFSSQGHNTMGGFDIFRSVYDSLSKQWSNPVNLSFPFNTPSDDILFIPDPDENTAWFASNRNSLNNKITVYKVGIIKKDQQSSDLSDVYDKEKLSSTDLAKIKNMAQLDINISNKKFEEIPVNQKHKLDALLKNDAVRITQNIRQVNLVNIDKQIAVQEMQSGLNDSIKTVVQQIENKLESLKSFYLQTQELVNAKEGLSQQGYEELSQQLEKAQKTALPEKRKEIIAEANKTLFKTLRIGVQHDKLGEIEQALNNEISAQRTLLAQANKIFGDIQKNIVTSNDAEAEKYIRRLAQLIQNADTLSDYTKAVDYTNGNLINPNYPPNLLDKNTFAAYYIQNENEYRSPILALETKFSEYIPEAVETTDKELLGHVENTTSKARLKNKQFSYQLKLTESLINERKQVSTQLLKQANRLIQAAGTKPTVADLKVINSKFAEARRAAFDTGLAEQIYDSLKITGIQSERIAEELSSLNSKIEELIEHGKNKDALKLAAQVEVLESEGNKLPTYEKTIDFKKKELIGINYPTVIKNIDSYIEYEIKAGKLKRKGGEPLSYQNVDELIESNFLLFKETAKPDQTTKIESGADSRLINEQQSLAKESNNSTETQSNNSSEQIRESLVKLSQKQTERIEQLKQQLAVLTIKSTEKLNASNQAKVDFERMRNQYNAGQISDQKSVLDKQSDSQNLLYQSFAIKGFAEKIDSILRSEQKRKEESTNQIFAIEQALQTDQAEKAKALYRTVDKNTKFPEIESLVQTWIAKGSESIPKQKTLANQAFENSQKLTDASIQLILEAKKIRKDALNKSNAFTRRELELDAKNKETLAIQKQDQADKQLALGTNLYEEIKKAEAIHLIASEFSIRPQLAIKTNPVQNPEKPKIETNKTIVASNKETSVSSDSNTKLLAVKDMPKIDLAIMPEKNDLMAFETKKYKAQLLSDDIDINKVETNYFLVIGKKLSGAADIENNKKISALYKEADSLRIASRQAGIEADKIYKQLPEENKKQADNNNANIDNYLKNVRDRIAQLLDDVTKLSDQASSTEEEASRKKLMLEADKKEQIASYLILEEYELIAQRNKQNFRKNTFVIDKLFQDYQSNQDKEMLQGMLNQIESYQQIANNKQIEAKREDLSFTLKKALLQDAFVQETKALDLQLETIRLMHEKDVKPMLASQSNKKVSNKSELPASEGKQTNRTETKTDISEQAIAANTIIPEKQKTQEKIIDQNIAIEPKTKATTISNTSTKKSKIFPNVSLMQEPTGTQFSVQIAAIGGLKTTDIFMNVIELFALKDKEKELYRYFSGTFSNLRAAIIRRNSLRLQGYTDAFVKTWKEGKVVSIAEVNANLDKNTNDLLNENVIALPSQYRNINFSATNISQLNGVYYSVQVGVFSRPRSSAQLFDIKPLYHNRFKNGNWIYFNGIFKSIAGAEENKTIIREKGIPDAFVVAFKEGEKVSFASARHAINQGFTQPTDDDIIILEEAANEVDEQLKVIIGQPNKFPVLKIYKVQIGVFSHEVSFDILLKKLNPNNIHRIEYFINSAGKYVYTLGSFNSYEKASEFKNLQLNDIVKDAFIVTFENGHKI